ncbi:MAG: PCRF domain-containing protein, partial [Chloroflexota bacterium]|nr:PCRF domain-containing protein [Chloroflexota bacterium]
MLDRLEAVEQRFEELNRLMAQPEIAADHQRMQGLAKEQAGISDLVSKYREYKDVARMLKETRSMLDDGLDEEMTALAKEEVVSLETRFEGLTRDLEAALAPRDEYADKDVIVEVRAGAGGD